jgi:hypothetical protein
LGGALLLLVADLLLLALLLCGALPLLRALLHLGALLLCSALFFLSALLHIRTLLFHSALIHRGALLLWDLGTLLLLDCIQNIPALLLGVCGTELSIHMFGHIMAFLHWLAAALLLLPGLVVSDSGGGTDWLRDCGAVVPGHCVIHCLTVGGHCYSVGHSLAIVGAIVGLSISLCQG